MRTRRLPEKARFLRPWLGTVLLGFTACGGKSVTMESGCPGYVVITGASFEPGAERLHWRVDLAEPPGQLVFNKSSTGANEAEYQWAVSMDLSGDQTPELELALTHFKFDGLPEVRSSDMSSLCQADLWEYVGGTARSINPSDGTAPPQIEFDGASVIFTVSISSHPDLARVTKTTPFVASTRCSLDAGSGEAATCSDRWVF
jgi:hypothetical protein